MKKAAGDAWEEHDYVFCTAAGKHLHPGHDVLEEVKKLLRKLLYPTFVSMIFATARLRCC